MLSYSELSLFIRAICFPVSILTVSFSFPCPSPLMRLPLLALCPTNLIRNCYINPLLTLVDSVSFTISSEAVDCIYWLLGMNNKRGSAYSFPDLWGSHNTWRLDWMGLRLHLPRLMSLPYHSWKIIPRWRQIFAQYQLSSIHSSNLINIWDQGQVNGATHQICCFFQP